MLPHRSRRTQDALPEEQQDTMAHWTRHILHITFIGAVTLASAPPLSYADIRISSMNAFSFGTWTNGDGDLTSNDRTCIYRDDAGSDYRVTITDDSTITASAFRMQDVPNTSELAYEVRWNDTAADGGTVVTDGTALTGQSGANTSSSDCSTGGVTSNIQIRITSADLGSATAGSYSAEISILAEPE